MDEKIKLLDALSDETRMKIVQCLMSGDFCACSIVPFIGKAQSTVSQHLKILEEAGVVESKRSGVNIWYRLRSKETMEILKILKIKQIVCDVKCEVKK